MTLTFPLDMPSRPPETVSFELDRNDLVTRAAVGRLTSVQAGFPLWRLDMDLTNLNAETFDEVRAWVAALNGAAGTFYGADPSRPYPKAHPRGFAGMRKADGVTAFTGAATSWSVDGTRSKLTLQGLPPDLVLSRGDYVGFRWQTSGAERRALVRALEAAVADATGKITDLPVSPAVPGGAYTLVPGGAVAYLDRPVCIMRLDPDQTTIGKIDPLNRAHVRVVALQDLRP